MMWTMGNFLAIWPWTTSYSLLPPRLLFPWAGQPHPLLALFLFYFLIFICLAASGPSCGAQDLHRIMWGLLLLRTRSLVAARGIWSAQPPVVAVNRLSRSTECGVLLLRPGIEPMSPALQGGFLTTGPPGKSPKPGLCVLAPGIPFMVFKIPFMVFSPSTCLWTWGSSFSPRVCPPQGVNSYSSLEIQINCLLLWRAFPDNPSQNSSSIFFLFFFFLHLNKKFIIFIFQVFCFSVGGKKRNLKDSCHLLPNWV